MDRNYPAEHFLHRHRLLLAVRDARVGHILHMEPEKIAVLGYHDTTEGRGELQMCRISRTDQARVRCGRHIDVAPPRAGSVLSRDALVQAEPERPCSGCFFQALLARFRFEQREMTTAGPLPKGALLLHVPLNLVRVVETVGQGGVDAGERDRRNVGGDLVGRRALALMPRYNIEHARGGQRCRSFRRTRRAPGQPEPAP